MLKLFYKQKQPCLASIPDQEKELNRRIKSIENGTAKFVSWDHVRKSLRERRNKKLLGKLARCELKIRRTFKRFD